MDWLTGNWKYIFILVSIHKSCIIYFEKKYAVPIVMEIHFFGRGKVMENHCWKRVVTLLMSNYFDYLLLLLDCITYVDAVYCYRPSSVVCQYLSQSFTVVSPAKMAEPIKMLFGLRTWVDPENHVLDGGSRSPYWKGQFWGGNWIPL